MDYNVQIGETGEHFNETIGVDTEKQTELFKVPAHGNVDDSDILHDFKTVSFHQNNEEYVSDSNCECS